MAVQALAAHEEFMKRVMKGTLLSRKVKTLKALNELKEVVNRYNLCLAQAYLSPSASLGWLGHCSCLHAIFLVIHTCSIDQLSGISLLVQM